jgi:hypothetical protein
MNHKEFSQKGGRSTSDKKREASRINMQRAREAALQKRKDSLIAKNAEKPLSP